MDSGNQLEGVDLLVLFELDALGAQLVNLLKLIFQVYGTKLATFNTKRVRICTL